MQRKKKCSFIFFPPRKKWNYDRTDADYMNKVYVQIQARKYYVTMQDNIYAFGIGTGAVIAQQAAMKMTSEWSGMATFGDMNESAMLNASAVQKSENMGKVELSISAAKAQLPVWMFWTKIQVITKRYASIGRFRMKLQKKNFPMGLRMRYIFLRLYAKTARSMKKKSPRYVLQTAIQGI